MGDNMIRTNSARLVLVAGLLATPFLAAAPAQAAIPSCNNYENQEQWGKVNVDLRPGATGNFTTLTIWWRVDPITARPGRYDTTHFVNGKPVRTNAVKIAFKDDAFHTVLRETEDGKTNWKLGDTYKFQGYHFSESEKKLYVAAVNECRITAR